MSRRFCFSLKASGLSCLAAIALSACQGLVSDERGGFILPPDLGLNSLMALPQPFRSDHNALPPLMRTSMGQTDVALPPVIGLSIANNHIIAAALTKAADDADILVLSDVPNRPTYVLEGIAKPTASTLSITWYLRNGKMHLIRKFDTATEFARTPDGLIRDDAARSLAEATTAALSSALDSTGGVMTVPVGKNQLANQGPPKIHIGEVTGAPGDGNRALPAALRTILGQDGVPLTDEADKSDFAVIAKIAKEALKNGSESMAITWQVIDRRGAVAGEITQSNEIKAGSLDGDWGQTAFDIALAAESGLGDMLSEIEARASGAETPEDSPGAGPVIPDSVLHRHRQPTPEQPEHRPEPAVGKISG
ncbi:MAG: hypothetical protein WAW96_05775 [Alphaproteobacteria bacterium]